MESQGDQSNPNPQGGAATTSAPADTERRFTDAEWRQVRRTQLDGTDLKELVQKVIDLEATNFKLRQRETPDGGKALTPDEVKEWDAFRALNLKPADLKKELDTGKTAAQELGTLKQEKETQQVASIGKADPTVLQDLLQRGNLTAKVQGEAPAAGEEDKRAVRLYDAEGKDVGELRTWAAEHRAAYVPALFPASTPAQPQGTVVNGQSGSRSTAMPTDPVQDYARRLLSTKKETA